MAAEGNQVDIRTLQPQQPQQLHQQLSGEIENFQSAIANLNAVKVKYNESRDCIKLLSDNSQTDSNILVPVTGSMYVPGKIIDTEKVLLDIGTGYYAERSKKDADDFCQRKLNLLDEQVIKIGKVLNMRLESQKVVQDQLKVLMMEQRKAQAAAAKAQ